jgi:hypothetical protein
VVLDFLLKEDAGRMKVNHSCGFVVRFESLTRLLGSKGTANIFKERSCNYGTDRFVENACAQCVTLFGQLLHFAARCDALRCIRACGYKGY